MARPHRLFYLMICIPLFIATSCSLFEGPYSGMVKSLVQSMGMPSSAKIIFISEGSGGGTSCDGYLYYAIMGSNHSEHDLILYYRTFTKGLSTQPWIETSELGSTIWSHQEVSRTSYIRVATQFVENFTNEHELMVDQARREYPTIYELAIHSGHCPTLRPD